MGWRGMVGCLVVMAARAASAGALPPEGKFEVVFCFAGDARTIEHSKDVVGGSLSYSGPVRSMVEGEVLDLTVANCHNTFTVVQGKVNEYGFCELTDGDGDRLFYAFTADGQRGKWTGYPGTGKFQNYLWQAEWERLGSFPNVIPGKVQGCQRAWGSFRHSKGADLQPK